MNRWVCNNCRNPCYLVMDQPSSFEAERCFLNNKEVLWKTDTKPHNPENYRSFVCNGCDTGKCYMVSVDLHILRKPKSCVYLDAFESDWVTL